MAEGMAGERERERMGILDSPNNMILKADTKVQEALEGLRQFVDNLKVAPNIGLRGESYRKIDPKKIQTVAVDGLVFGYRLEDHAVFIRRIVFIKVPGYRLEDISESERARIMTAVFNVFVVPGAGVPEISRIAPDALRLTQDIVPMVLVEQKPGLVSIAGGFGGKDN